MASLSIYCPGIFPHRLTNNEMLEIGVLRSTAAVERRRVSENWTTFRSNSSTGIVGNLFYDTNGQNFLIRGIRLLSALGIAGLTFQGAASWNHSRQTTLPL